MFPNFEEILLELSYRTDNGIVDLSKPAHVSQLIRILEEYNIPNPNQLAESASRIWSSLNEADEFKALNKNGTVSTFGSAEARDAAIKSGSHTTIKTNDVKPKKSDGNTIDFKSSAEKDKEDPTIPDTTVFGKPKQEKPDNTKTFTPSNEDIQRKQLDDTKLLEIVKFGLVPTAEKQLKGVGIFDPTETQLIALREVTEKQLKDPSYRLPLPKYEVSEEQIDKTIDIMKTELGNDFRKVKQSITKSGAVATELTTGEAGVQRFRDIVKLYLSNGGRSVVTGEVVPFNQMQLDHHIPYSNAGKIVEEKRKKGVKTTLLDEQDRLDSADNWDLIETPLNQLKKSLEGSSLLDKIVKKLSASPNDKELVKLKNEITTIRREKLREYFIKSIGVEDFSGINEDTLKKMNRDERMALMKAWNYWHPSVMEFNTMMKLDPTYEKKLKKMGVTPPPPDNKYHIIRYKFTADVRVRALRRSVADEVDVVATTMINSGVNFQTTENLDATNSILDKGRQMVEKEAGAKQKQIDLIKVKQRDKK
jgi:hypothetical protein